MIKRFILPLLLALVLSPTPDFAFADTPPAAKRSKNACPASKLVSGYEFVRGKDFNGHNIKLLGPKGSVNDFAKACSKESRCKSFNSWGHLKFSSAEKDSKYWQKEKVDSWNTCRGRYIKKSSKKPTAKKPTAKKPTAKKETTNCNKVQVHGYEFVRGKDYNGHNIKLLKGSVNDFAKACRKDSKCKSFNSWGHLKSSSAEKDSKYWQKEKVVNWNTCRGMYIQKWTTTQKKKITKKSLIQSQG